MFKELFYDYDINDLELCLEPPERLDPRKRAIRNLKVKDIRDRLIKTGHQTGHRSIIEKVLCALKREFCYAGNTESSRLIGLVGQFTDQEIKALIDSLRDPLHPLVSRLRQLARVSGLSVPTKRELEEVHFTRGFSSPREVFRHERFAISSKTFPDYDQIDLHFIWLGGRIPDKYLTNIRRIYRSFNQFLRRWNCRHRLIVNIWTDHSQQFRYFQEPENSIGQHQLHDYRSVFQLYRSEVSSRIKELLPLFLRSPNPNYGLVSDVLRMFVIMFYNKGKNTVNVYLDTDETIGGKFFSLSPEECDRVIDGRVLEGIRESYYRCEVSHTGNETYDKAIRILKKTFLEELVEMEDSAIKRHFLGLVNLDISEGNLNFSDPSGIGIKSDNFYGLLYGTLFLSGNHLDGLFGSYYRKFGRGVGFLSYQALSDRLGLLPLGLRFPLKSFPYCEQRSEMFDLTRSFSVVNNNLLLADPNHPNTVYLFEEFMLPVARKLTETSRDQEELQKLSHDTNKRLYYTVYTTGPEAFNSILLGEFYRTGMKRNDLKYRKLIGCDETIFQDEDFVGTKYFDVNEVLWSLYRENCLNQLLMMPAIATSSESSLGTFARIPKKRGAKYLQDVEGFHLKKGIAAGTKTSQWTEWKRPHNIPEGNCPASP
jgi:hypothetical protein